MGRLIIFVNFALAILAGMGLDDVRNGLTGKWPPRVMGLIGAVSLVALVASVVLWMGFRATPPEFWVDFFGVVRREGGEFYREFAGEGRREILEQGFARMLRGVAWQAAVLLAAAATIVLTTRKQIEPRWVVVSLLSLLAVELGLFEWQYVVLNDTRPWREIARNVKAALPEESEPFRVAGFSQNPPLSPNRFLYARLESVGGHENFVLERYSLFLYRWLGIDPQWQTYLTVPHDAGLYKLLNVKYYVTPHDQMESLSADELIRARVFQFQGRDFSLFRNREVLPRVNLVHQVHWADDIESASQSLPRLAKGRFESDCVVEASPEIELSPVSAADRARERVSIREYAPGRLEVDVECVAPGVLIFIENYCTGWQATIDGEPAPVWPANLFMIAAPVTPGRHRVVLSFESPAFTRGCMLAGISLCVIAGSFAIPYLLRRRKRS
jgi:hypothetical protein